MGRAITEAGTPTGTEKRGADWVAYEERHKAEAYMELGISPGNT